MVDVIENSALRLLNLDSHHAPSVQVCSFCGPAWIKDFRFVRAELWAYQRMTRLGPSGGLVRVRYTPRIAHSMIDHIPQCSRLTGNLACSLALLRKRYGGWVWDIFPVTGWRIVIGRETILETFTLIRGLLHYGHSIFSPSTQIGYITSCIIKCIRIAQCMWICRHGARVYSGQELRLILWETCRFMIQFMQRTYVLKSSWAEWWDKWHSIFHPEIPSLSFRRAATYVEKRTRILMLTT